MILSPHQQEQVSAWTPSPTQVTAVQQEPPARLHDFFREQRHLYRKRLRQLNYVISISQAEE